MKRPSPLVKHRNSGTDMEAAMTPMIDVVFLLLVFFVWTAGFQVIEQILASEMSSQMGTEPTAVSDPPPDADFDNVVVRIGWDGANPNWKLNDLPVASIKQLRDQLTAISGIKSDAPVILHPEAKVPLGFVIEAYDVSKLAGFSRVSFAVNRDAG